MHMNLVRRGALVLAAVGIALGTAAFASGASATTTVASTHAVVTAVTPLKVALIAPSATNDLAFTQSMYSALESLKTSENLTISVSANEYVVSDAASIIREYASRATTSSSLMAPSTGHDRATGTPVPEGRLRVGNRRSDVRSEERLCLRGILE